MAWPDWDQPLSKQDVSPRELVLALNEIGLLPTAALVGAPNKGAVALSAPALGNTTWGGAQVQDAGGMFYSVKNPKWNESAPGKGDGGAKGDGQTDTTGSISAAGTVLTVTNPVFKASDIGKLIFISHGGAASGSSNLRIANADGFSGCKIVAPFIDSTHVNISVPATVSVPGPRTVTDAAITVGTNQVTSATAAFVTGDNGKVLSIVGAGPGGTTLTAPILLVANATTVTLVDVTASVTVSGASATVSGALITWGTDDRLPIQAAIDACNAAGGGTVLAPTGIFCLSYGTTGTIITGLGGNIYPCLLIRSNVWVRGVGHGTSVFQAGDKWSGAGANNAIFCEAGGKGETTNWRLLELTLDGGHVYSLIANEISQFLVTASAATNWRIEETEVTNCGSKSVYVNAQTGGAGVPPWAANVIIRHNYFHGISGNFIGLNYVTDYLIAENVFENGAIDNAECLINGGCSRGLITGNLGRDIGNFSVSKGGFTVGGDLAVVANYTRILNNPGENTACSGGSASITPRILIALNIFDTSPGASVIAVLSFGGVIDLTITGNTLKSDSANTPCIALYIGADPNTNVLVSNNRCINGKIRSNAAITTNCTISGNIAEAGIFPGTNEIVIGNWVGGGGIGGGTPATATGCQCLGNYVTVNSATFGIDIAGSSLIEGNVVIQAGSGNCVWLYGTDSIVKGNVLQRTGSGGIWLVEGAGADYNLIEGNSLLSGGGVPGFTIVGAHTKICNNPRYNPQGGVTTPGFPATTVAVQNTTGVDCFAMITNNSAGAMTLVITGIKGNVTLTLPVGLATVPLPAGQSYTPTYAGGSASTHVWYGM